MPPTTSTLALASERDLGQAAPPAAAPVRAGALGAAAACWGVAAQLVLLFVPARQLSHAAVDALAAPAAPAWSWPLAAASVAALCYLMGYRGFQRGYAPLVAARAAHLARHPRPWHVASAPLYVCGLVHASRRRRVATALIFAIMPALAVASSRLPEPWRAVVGLGVAFGLLWGTVAVLVFSLRAAAGRAPAVSLDLPAASSR